MITDHALQLFAASDSFLLTDLYSGNLVTNEFTLQEKHQPLPVQKVVGYS